jgi:hypothetical protein
MTDLLQIMLDMRNGQVAADCNQKFNEVLKAVLDTGGKGDLTIKLSIRPAKMGMGGAVIEVETEHECKLKKPELQVGRSTFFVTKEGDLTREDPDQVAMFEGKELTADGRHN